MTSKLKIGVLCLAAGLMAAVPALAETPAPKKPYGPNPTNTANAAKKPPAEEDKCKDGSAASAVAAECLAALLNEQTDEVVNPKGTKGK